MQRPKICHLRSLPMCGGSPATTLGSLQMSLLHAVAPPSDAMAGPGFEPPPRVRALRKRLLAFMDTHVYKAEPVLEVWSRPSSYCQYTISVCVQRSQNGLVRIAGGSLAAHMSTFGGSGCQELANSERRWTVHPVMEELKARARAEGLWNLWISPALAACVAPAALAGAAKPDRGLLGMGLSNLVLTPQTQQSAFLFMPISIVF